MRGRVVESGNTPIEHIKLTFYITGNQHPYHDGPMTCFHGGYTTRVRGVAFWKKRRDGGREREKRRRRREEGEEVLLLYGKFLVSEMPPPSTTLVKPQEL